MEKSDAAQERLDAQRKAEKPEEGKREEGNEEREDTKSVKPLRRFG